MVHGAFVRISDHGEMGRESTWTIKSSRDAGEVLNDSDEMKCRNSLLVLPRSKCSAKAKARIPFNPFLLSALGLPEAEVASGSLCLETTDGWIISFFHLSGFFLKSVTGNILYVFSVYEATELIILVWRNVEGQCCLELGDNPS